MNDGTPLSRLTVIALVLALSMLLLACGQGNGSRYADLVPFDALIADPQEYADQVLCTEGVQVDGYEASGLAGSTYTKDGYLHLTEPVIWLEGADVQSRENCTWAEADPMFEFCQIVVCGIYETGGGYGHGGAYAYQLRGRDVSALPSPAATSSPVPTAPLTYEATSTPVLNGKSAHEGPPPAILEVDGREQASGIGNYCWPQFSREETAIVCADAFAVITPEEPLVISSPSTARFRLTLEEEPDRLFLQIALASPDDELAIGNEGWRAWPGGQGERRELALLREPQAELDLAPGLYVLDLQAGWDEWGDVSYGFLVEVPLPLPALTVDESPIVAAVTDGPGHFEYTDRLGEQLQARIEGLRAFADEQELARNNAALAPLGYRLEAHFDAEWDRAFYDLYREGDAEPVVSGLSHIWPVSVNASGTDFVLAAENAPNVLPLYLQVRARSVEPWDADRNAFLPPAFVGDDLARVTFTGFPTLTYQVELDGLAVYSGTAVAQGAYMPLRSFTAWDGHWALEVDDHVIVDGQDLGRASGYEAVFGFSLIHGQPFYFFEQESKVRMSYGGLTLPNAYDEVFHSQCCEAAIHNVEFLGDVVLFHALWNGTWCFVEAGVYDGEMAGTYRYTAPEGWSFRYPMHWGQLDEELGFVQDTATGKTVTFASMATTQAGLERWIESEIDRKLAATEAKNTMAEPLTAIEEGVLTIYRYAILSRMDGSETLLRTTVFFDGQRRYEFHAAIPPMAEEEYGAIVGSLMPGPAR